MKWFKHHTDLSRDEGIRCFFERAGEDWVTAYGLLMLVLELIGEKMQAKEGDLQCSASYSIKGWSMVLGCHVNRLKKYMDLLGVIPWVSVEFEEGNYRVSVPKMAQWRDDTTRRYGKGSEQVAQNRTEQKRPEKRENNDALSDSQSEGAPSHTPPRSYVLTSELRSWAAKKYSHIDVESEFEKFRYHEFPTARTDWEAAFKQWMQKAHEYWQRQKGGAASSRGGLDITAAQYGMFRRSGEMEDEFRARVRDESMKRLYPKLHNGAASGGPSR